ncbi:glutamate receptor ionotropic, delta-1 [Nephila pilipes]|uniref:Glutamate receptor ionotropic, delta-1 n=1 Tax=Nephila pilipes TaxID=299642 RepID=A0A8X6QQ79_NEPPI|nr:glutamate receptor ionotropic, delta-1 [Nephila pilipes]
MLRNKLFFYLHRYEIVVPPDQHYGMLINGSYWTGLVGMLMNNEADMAASPLSITQERKNAVTFSFSLYKDSLGLLFTRPEGRQNNEALLAPFTNTLPLFFDPLLASVNERGRFSIFKTIIFTINVIHVFYVYHIMTAWLALTRQQWNFKPQSSDINIAPEL